MCDGVGVGGQSVGVCVCVRQVQVCNHCGESLCEQTPGLSLPLPSVMDATGGANIHFTFTVSVKILRTGKVKRFKMGSLMADSRRKNVLEKS